MILSKAKDGKMMLETLSKVFGLFTVMVSPSQKTLGTEHPPVKNEPLEKNLMRHPNLEKQRNSAGVPVKTEIITHNTNNTALHEASW